MSRPVMPPEKATQEAQDWTSSSVPVEPYRFARRRRKGWRPRQLPSPDRYMEAFAPPPRQLDWRSRINVAGPMDQGACNACTSFAFAGVMTDMATIKVGQATPLLSPGHFHWCVAGHDCASGLDPNDAVKAAKATPVALQQGGDYPYDPASCRAARGVVRLGYAFNVTSFPGAINALQDGPIIVVMDLYQDFWEWKSKEIYRHHSGRYLNRHTIAIIGYDAGAQCWVVRNSQGTDWGYKGFARVAFGECNILTPTGNWGLQLVLA